MSKSTLVEVPLLKLRVDGYDCEMAFINKEKICYLSSHVRQHTTVVHFSREDYVHVDWPIEIAAKELG